MNEIIIKEYGESIATTRKLLDCEMEVFRRCGFDFARERTAYYRNHTPGEAKRSAAALKAWNKRSND